MMTTCNRQGFQLLPPYFDTIYYRQNLLDKQAGLSYQSATKKFLVCQALVSMRFDATKSGKAHESRHLLQMANGEYKKPIVLVKQRWNVIIPFLRRET